MKTNLFIVGGQRCGTTWLTKQLDLCPSVNLLKPISPETKYFLNDYANREEFNSLFDQSSGKILLEKATTYIESKEAAKRIKLECYNPKIIICLRDPVERALSNYFFSVNNGLETRKLEEVFLKNTPAPEIDLSNFSTNPFDYLQRGMYSTYIQNYLDVFDKEDVYITFMENFTKDSRSFYDIVSWIGAHHYPRLLPAENSSYRQKVHPNIISHLKNYYLEDTNKLINDFNLKPPYANQ
jgi:hypothetical protein